MTTTRLAVLFAAFFALASGTASAQTAVPCADCQAPNVTPHHPRLYRLLEVVSEPSVIFNPSPYPGYVPTTHPFLDAAPNAARLTFFALSLADMASAGGLTAAVPAGIRLLRVALYGMPFAATGRETVLWVLSPAALRAKRNYQETGHFLKTPVVSRNGGAVFPRLHARLYGAGRAGRCDCR